MRGWLCIVLAIVTFTMFKAELTISPRKNSPKLFKDHDATTPGKNKSSLRKLLPQLPPHRDSSFLIEFVGDGVEACIQMEPLVQRLEKELGTRVRRINIAKRPDFMALFDLVGGNEGGSLPFFYNRRTAQAICGPTYYSNLLKLGTSDRRHLFYDVPTQEQELNDNRRKSTGLMGYFEGVGKRFVKQKADDMLDKLLDGGENETKSK